MRYTHREIELAEPAWHYPPHGSHWASCGHRVFAEPDYLATADYDSSSDGSFGRVVSYGCYCPPCALRLMVGGHVLTTEDAQDRWLDGCEYRGGE